MFLPPTPQGKVGKQLGFESQEAGRRNKVKTSVEHQPETMQRETKIMSPILGGELQNEVSHWTCSCDEETSEKARRNGNTKPER